MRVYLDTTTEAPRHPAAVCADCGCENGLMLLPDGRFVCKGYCGRLNLNVIVKEAKRRGH